MGGIKVCKGAQKKVFHNMSCQTLLLLLSFDTHAQPAAPSIHLAISIKIAGADGHSDCCDYSTVFFFAVFADSCTPNTRDNLLST